MPRYRRYLCLGVCLSLFVGCSIKRTQSSFDGTVTGNPIVKIVMNPVSLSSDVGVKLCVDHVDLKGESTETVTLPVQSLVSIAEEEIELGLFEVPEGDYQEMDLFISNTCGAEAVSFSTGSEVIGSSSNYTLAVPLNFSTHIPNGVISVAPDVFVPLSEELGAPESIVVVEAPAEELNLAQQSFLTGWDKTLDAELEAQSAFEGRARFELISPPQGSLSLSSDGRFKYKPKNFNGEKDQFSVRLRVGVRKSETFVVQINFPQGALPSAGGEGPILISNSSHNVVLAEDLPGSMKMKDYSLSGPCAESAETEGRLTHHRLWVEFDIPSDSNCEGLYVLEYSLETKGHGNHSTQRGSYSFMYETN